RCIHAVLVTEPADIEGVAFVVAYPFAAEAAPAAMCQSLVDVLVFVGFCGFYLLGVEAPFTFAAFAAAVGFFAIRLFVGVVVVFGEGGAVAGAGHFGAQVVGPYVLCVVFVLVFVFGAALGKKQHLGFYAVGVEDAGGQAQDRVQVALVHQVAAYVGAGAG